MSEKHIFLETTLEVNGKEVKDITLDFNKLTGLDLLDAEQEARMAGDTTPVLILSSKYQCMIAARLLGAKYDDIIALPARDFVRITSAVANFLTGSL